MRCWLVCLAACTSATPPARPLTVDELRAEVLSQVKPFADRPEYAVTDPAFIDPCIAAAIQEGGERDWVVRSAVMKVGNKLAQPDGLARIEKLVADRYAHPVITQDGQRVTIDAGVIAGKLHVFRGSMEIDTSPALDRGEWATTEIVRFLKLGIAKYPDATEYDALVTIPATSKRPDWRYAYDRPEGTIRISQKDWRAPVFVTENLGPDLTQIKSLNTSGMKVDPKNRSPSGD
jgi:hypothetical protein